ncbi:MAG: acetate--CoA ligase, partial [bacterium]|nr:acetate--CoA ligase [bacterium]
MKKILKPSSCFKSNPNLEDYERTYRLFDLEEVKKELGWNTHSSFNAGYFTLEKNAQDARKNKIGLFWEGENNEKQKYTFEELDALSNQFGNLLKSHEVERGDRVFFFLPRIPLLYFGFVGTIKIGAIAGTMFAAFGPQAIFDRLHDSGAKVLVTDRNLGLRLKSIRSKLPRLEKIIYVEEIAKPLSEQKTDLKVAQMDPDDPAFMLYTSGTTGKPKGVVHSHKAILQEYLTAKWVLDIKDGDVYWCTADPGWVTGIAYSILGSWAAGATSFIYGGNFNPEKWYQLIQDYKVNVWYTAPTAIRMLMARGNILLKKYDLSSLRHLCSVGEPLNPECIVWSVKYLGLPFHDNWWQTETGGILIANYPILPIKPGSMGKPVPGVRAAIVDDKGRELAKNKIGNLAIKPGWPSMMKTIWHRPVKYDSYFKHGYYISGDLAYRDEDGYFWFVGRSDDVIKTSGERVGPFEVESSLIEHPAVVEAGVIGKPDPVRGQIIKAFVVLKKDVQPSDKLKRELQEHVKKHLAGHAYPREIAFIDRLP